MSAFMVSNHLMQKVVTAVLQNTDEFTTIQTFRGRLVDDPPTDAQCKAAENIGKRDVSWRCYSITGCVDCQAFDFAAKFRAFRRSAS